MTSEHWFMAILAAYSAYITGLHNWFVNKYFKRACREGQLEAQLKRERMLRRMSVAWQSEEENNL